jgi:hypothetical protein
MKGEDPEWTEGDRTWSIKRLGILSVLLMSVAEAYKDKTPEDIKEMQGKNKAMQMLEVNFDMLPHVPSVALNQSILTGSNTMFQALLGGEAEKDRWLTSMSTVYSTMLYPNTVAVISQTADPERFIRETRDLSVEQGMQRTKQHIVNTFKDRLFMSKQLPAKVSIWGDPVLRIPEGERWTYNLFGITKEKKYQKYSFGTRLFELFEDYDKTNPDEASGILPSLPSASTKVGWNDARMTPDQLEEYQIGVGKRRAEDTEAYVNSQEWEDATMEDRITVLRGIYSKARIETEADMFRWLDYQNIDETTKANWDIMLKLDAVPLPSMSKKIGDHKLAPAEVKQINEMAMSYYAAEVVPFLRGQTEKSIENLKKPDPETGESEFITELNDIWKTALNDARDNMADILEKEGEMGD